MKRLLVSGTVLCICVALLLAGVSAAVTTTMPPYRDAAGDDNYTEKITGRFLVQQSAAQGDLILYGSSELRTLEISTHPANFFAGRRSGFQVNLVGRGSCQSLIHALSIAASGDALTGQKVVLITSPQSYVEEGIAPDLFTANFSEQQYLELLRAGDLSEEVRRYLSERVAELLAQYAELEDAVQPDIAIRYLAKHQADPTPVSTARDTLLTPYYALSRYLHDLDDKAASRRLLQSLDGGAPGTSFSPRDADIDWDAEEQAAMQLATQMTDNNEFGILNDYYTTYIGSRLSRQEGRDRDLDYTVSREYDDLRALFEVCRQKGIEPLFIHVPLHGQWSDYTGFSSERREQYYQNVRAVVEEYGVQMLDLTGQEYAEYYMCDIMHLGWRGWLDVDRALIDYYYHD